jgi:signal transduction histidine kinase/ligand-binding sensor domain-containing protein
MSVGSQRRSAMLRTRAITQVLALVVLATIGSGVARAAPQGNRVVELGPPVAAVYAFFQSSDSAMWMGGQQGVTRFDGARSTTFASASIPGLATTHAFHLQGGADESIWLTTGWGLPSMFEAPPHKGGLPGAAGLFHWSKNQWENVGGNAQIPSLTGQAMFSDPQSDRVWIASETALWVVHKNGAQIVAAANAIASEWITSIAFDKGTMWLGTTSAVYRLEIDNGDTPAHVVMKGAVTKLAADRKGGVWVGTYDGLFHVDANNEAAVDVPGLPSRNVRDFSFDRAENLWVATLGGVCRIGAEAPLCWTEHEGLPEPRVFSVYVDQDDVVWLGTRAAGVARLVPQRVSTLRRGQGLEGYVAHAVTAAKNGGMWVATDSAVSLHKDGIVQPLLKWETPPFWLSMSQDDTGALWIGKSDGDLFRVTPNGATKIDQGDHAHVAIHTIAIPMAGELWVGWQTGGMSRASIGTSDQDTHELHYAHFTPLDGVCPGIMVAAVTMPSDTMWFLMDSGWISQLRAGKFSCLRVAPNDLREQKFSTLMRDLRGDLWLGAVENGGLYLYRDGRFLHADETDGMACDSIHVLVDDGDDLWTACGTGVQRLNKTQVIARMLGGKELLSPIRFDASGGMASQEASWLGGPVAAKDPKGHLWVATQLGISIIDGHLALPEAPRPRIESMQINGIINNDENIPAIRASSFFVTALLASTSLTSQGRVYHRYRILGYDDTWQAASSGLSLTLPQLRWGTYTLEVVASNGFGVWSKEPARRTFILKQPFHRNPIVIGTAAILAVLVVLAIYQSRRRRQRLSLELLRQERDRMSRDLHDGMGQGFSSIGFHLEAIEESIGQSPQNLESLRTLLGQTREILDRSQAAARQAVWDLRDLQEQTPDLGVALSAMVRTHMLGRMTPRVTVKVGTLAGPRNLFAEQELGLLAKEALTNALRHAQAKNVVIEVERDSDFLHLSIKDDGVGLKEDQETLASHGHFGILGMNERVRRLGGNISITSAPDQGTEIAVTVPTGKSIHPTA